MKPIISVEGLGKSYTIRHEGQTRYKSLREEIFNLPKRLFQHSSQRQEEFWALKDVSLDVMPGDRLGIIGRNGAGKSTLLKLLSRITEPTTGRITLRGRVASLLEVGTGFHPELTGRENIFLNGAILGMSRAEVRRKFDEIVDFAGVEKFLDTPVKRYSSGMYVRLAFAVAAHLEPEILIVDEVLAVGDAEFQKKCLGKMEEVGKEGRTVLFVSHNMDSIKRLCPTGVLLQHGEVQKLGSIKKIIDSYLVSNLKSSLVKNKINRGNEYINLLNFSVVDKNGATIVSSQESRAEIFIQIEVQILSDDAALNFGFSVTDSTGNVLYWSFVRDDAEEKWPDIFLGNNRYLIPLPPNLFNSGLYSFEFIAGLHMRRWLISPGQGEVIQLEVNGGFSDSPIWTITRPGFCAPLLQWERYDEK